MIKKSPVIIFIFVLIFGLARTAQALEIPSQLTRVDLTEVIKILGYSTGSKFLSNPFPLGGFSGYEFGYSTEFINITDLSRLGAGAEQKSTFQFSRLTFGKGLYNDVDIFFHFSPFLTSSEIIDYGTQLKWNFYQATYLPFSLSVIGHFSNINIQDKFINEILGWDLLGGINLNNFALFFGVGSQRARSTFNQSVLDLTDPQITINPSGTFNINGSQTHTFVGMNIDISNLFLAAQIDRYEQPVYSAKIGFRF